MSKTDMKTREISPSFRGSLLEKVDLGVDKAPLSEEDAGATKKTLQDSAWADGLRGVAAVFVMFSHMSLCFIRYTAQPSRGDGGPSYWMQKPFFRLVASGPAWVACFFILSGFVNSLKPIKLARNGQTETALSNLAISSFRRSFRLFLPATAATIIAWFFCQLGAFETARNSDAYWIQITSPAQSWTLWSSFEDLLGAIRQTWTFNPDNPYDQPQWALLYFFLGSMFVFTTLLVTANMTPRFRMLTLILCWFWSWNWSIRFGDPLVFVNIYGGIILAEVNFTDIPLKLSRYSLVLYPPLVILCLLFMSYPSECPHWTKWSLSLFKMYQFLAPASTEMARFWPSIGAQLLSFTIMFSPHLHRFFTQPFLLWLGKVSFPIYLLHGMVMRSVLAWILFAGQSLVPIEEQRPRPAPEEGYEMVVVMRYPLPNTGMYFIALPAYFIFLGGAAHLWTIKLEPIFGSLTKQAEDIMFGKESRQAPLPVRHD